jgi:hypothetical protein
MPLVATQLKLNGQGGAPVDRGSKNQRAGSSHSRPTSRPGYEFVTWVCAMSRNRHRAQIVPKMRPITGRLQPP